MGTATDVFESPLEAVIGGLVYQLSRDPQIRDAALANDFEHFSEVCRSSEFPLAYPTKWDAKVITALYAIKEACL